MEALKASDGKIQLDEETVTKLRENPKIEAILEDEELVESIKKRDFARIIADSKFMALLNDKELLKQLADMGLKVNKEEE